MLKGIRVKPKDKFIERISEYFDERNAKPVVCHWMYICYPYGWQKNTDWLFILWAYVYCVTSEKYGEKVLCQRRKLK